MWPLRQANFCSFGRAMLTMFRCATGEDWNAIMHDAAVTPERGCDPSLGNCGTPLAVPFFVSYIILTSFVVLKMLVGAPLLIWATTLRHNCACAFCRTLIGWICARAVMLQR